ncbi:diguanylate cyclase (GGDEF) domain-containing protein [Hoeflea sp. IMCC20628]|uniref:sensor domain-containing diguanylate cyclase n=1 Tax=Hoeflea sp. IMCC20628 TaxID=1620421 RepID=UPI00063ABA2F|nr:diguanylate cyclase [Hoeflea sp. IMCC20628]AKI01327.1 diguanylate cyclase (GGDEF) domain-containing protein [Hoeflea sp. IMCC20628]
MKKMLNHTARPNIAIGVYALCIAVLAAFAVSNLQILSFAGGVADDVRSEVEQHLVQAEFERQIDVLVRDQSQISYWDKTVKALRGPVDEEFIENEIADWLWEDFDIESSVVVQPDGTPLVAVFRSLVMDPAAGFPYVVRNRDLVEAARQNYLARRTPRNGGYVITGQPARFSPPLHAADVRIVDGQFGVVIAQAIIPDDVEVLPDGMPQVLLTFKPLNQPILSNIGEKVGLEDLSVAPVAAPVEGRSTMVISQVTGQPPLAASWKVEQPSVIIWKRSIGALAGSFVLVSVALLLVSLRYGRALKALQLSEARNRHRAMHDNLTGLPNRLQFDDALDAIVAEHRQDRCAILCLDLDKFKAVNDTHGHQVGDLVITTAARRIADAVGDAGMAARVGGDEFIILLWDKLDRASVLARCDRMIASVCEDIAFDGGVARIGASIGVAWWPDDALTAKNIIRSADEALYRAKDNGRGQAWFAGDSGEAEPEATDRRRPAVVNSEAARDEVAA